MYGVQAPLVPMMLASGVTTQQTRAKVVMTGFCTRGPSSMVGLRTRQRDGSSITLTRVSAGGGGHHPKWGPYEADEYPSPDFMTYCKEVFPEEGVATLEEARTLMSEEVGYKILDVRSVYEYDSVGKVVGSTNIPLIFTKKRFGPEGIIYDQTRNPEFMDMVEKTFANKDQGILLMCSDGINRSIQALIMMEAQGYTNIVGVKYGYNGWINKYTPKLERRRQEYHEDYKAIGDSQGLHIVPHKFNVDPLIPIPIRDTTEWLEYDETATVDA